MVASTPFQVFKKIAKRGKASSRYFYGFKLHLIMNDKGKIFVYMLTP
ncbi:transposase [Neochlamydia sp. TUME1]